MCLELNIESGLRVKRVANHLFDECVSSSFSLTSTQLREERKSLFTNIFMCKLLVVWECLKMRGA